MITVSKMTTN